MSQSICTSALAILSALPIFPASLTFVSSDGIFDTLGFEQELAGEARHGNRKNVGAHEVAVGPTLNGSISKTNYAWSSGVLTPFSFTYVPGSGITMTVGGTASAFYGSADIVDYLPALAIRAYAAKDEIGVKLSSLHLSSYGSLPDLIGDGDGNYLLVNSPALHNGFTLTGNSVMTFSHSHAGGANGISYQMLVGTTAASGEQPLSQIPEPSTAVMMGVGCILLGASLFFRRWRKTPRKN